MPTDTRLDDNRQGTTGPNPNRGKRVAYPRGERGHPVTSLSGLSTERQTDRGRPGAHRAFWTREEVYGWEWLISRWALMGWALATGVMELCLFIFPMPW